MVEHQAHIRVEVHELERYCAALLRSAGVEAGEALEVARALVWAEAKGITSHGVRLLPIYTKRFQAGLVRSPASVSRVREGPCWVVLDGGSGFGPVLGSLAAEEATRRASIYGLAAVWVRNATHFGAAGYYAWQIATKGMIGCVLCNAAPTMTVWGAREVAIGTNPIALAAPSEDGFPILLDMATSVVSRQTINLARDRGMRIPLGWALDEEGHPTDLPGRAAMLLPFGGYKGSGLAIFVEILCGLVGGACSRHEIGRLAYDFDRPEGIGQFYLAMDLKQVSELPAYGRRMREMVQALRHLRPAEGVDRVLLPGEREFAAEAANLQSGLLLDPSVARDVFAMGDAFGVPRPALM
ncbi:MAG: Ldh family oxidoreductase [Armatimonadota bacterium]|nr:Ldh family oxidoreductase [Armatimonadota bacterium]MDR7463167.1 Ldh family oxidoreductase [Armatimonadota bacterium]MDR7468846.1 Ldh family oxidoreductase [Armatimonadota bacterium]MDR7475412.1 Ldh family oxidoreductase [Armatimonadota bacterium]MDR7540185.1 Ldh family oxidoreductase [Armatimonadota bacterium]